MITMHVDQRMCVRGSRREVRRFFAGIRGRRGSRNELFDLERAVQMPLVVRETCLSAHKDLLRKIKSHETYHELNARLEEARERCLKQTGYFGWEEWAFENWGTQWNVYHIRRVDGTDNELVFQSGERPIFYALLNLSIRFPQVIILLDYTCEDLHSSGRAMFSTGDWVKTSCSVHTDEGAQIRKRVLADNDFGQPSIVSKYIN